MGRASRLLVVFMVVGSDIPKPRLARVSTVGCDRAACVFKAGYQMFPQVSTVV